MVVWQLRDNGGTKITFWTQYEVAVYTATSTMDCLPPNNAVEMVSVWIYD